MPKTDPKTAMKDLRAFIETPSFWAIAGPYFNPITPVGITALGRLPLEWQDRYHQDRDRADARIAYTVMSYETPVAWVLLDEDDNPVEVVVPRVKYSATTSRVQARCKDLPYYYKFLVTTPKG